MRIYAVNLLSGIQQPPIPLPAWRRRMELGIVDGQGSKEAGDAVIAKVPAQRSGLELVRNGSDVTVTNYGLSGGVAISGQPLAYGVKYVWLEHQDLQVGKQHLLRWEKEPPRDFRGCGWQLAWLALVVLLLLPFLALATFWGGPTAAGARQADAGAQLGQLTATPSQNLTPTILPSSSITPTATIPLPTLQPLLTRLAPPVVVAAVDSVTLTQQLRASNAQATTAAQAAATAAAATPAPCTPAPFTQVNWDPAISMWVTPACLYPGDQYWRLVEAKWLSDERFQGYQHLFVDIKDENMARITGATFVMSWPDGRCKLSIGQGITEPFEHGNHCPMFSPADSYEVRVEGLPSEVVHGLGLGAVHTLTGPAEYMTSFYLLFQRTTYQGG